ncbi:MAG TPA: ATP-dependent metallopeptidase FtsH/Yme1/Tma family protein, partial [Candidatus Agathobaculum stercoravium]|nr:ATP-dependent metallopeptidase FtsH/Yme1/Tma family protein [Candidatus Agathobaculum stercoravium]
MKGKMKGFGLYLIILVFLLAGVSYVVSQTQQTESITYLDVYHYFKDGNVEEYTMDGGTLTMRLRDNGRVVSYELGDYFNVFYAELGETIQQQEQDGTLKSVDYITTTIPWWAQFLPYIILLVLLGAFWYFMMNKQ